MATFTHTLTWTTNVEGRAVTYSFSYDIADVDDMERYSSGRQDAIVATLRSEPVLSAVLVDIGPGILHLVESAGPTSLTSWNVDEGDLVVFHQSDSGGTWNSSGSDATTTLRSNDQIGAGGSGSVNHAGFEFLVLHQPAS